MFKLTTKTPERHQWNTPTFSVILIVAGCTFLINLKFVDSRLDN